MFGPSRSRVGATTDLAAPLAVLFLGYPLWWVLGVQTVAWACAAGIAALWLVRNRGAVEVPPGHLLLLGFLGWVVLSGLMVDGPKQLMSSLLRLTLYAAALLIGLMVWNLVRHDRLGPERVLGWLTWVWGVSMILAVVGIIRPGVTWVSPMGALIRGVGLSDRFLLDLTTPRLADLDTLYGVPRPTPLFEYTNVWGAAMGVLTPVAVYALLTARTRRRRLVLGGLLVISIIPIVVSVNRGLWLSLILAVTYVVGRRAMAGDLRAFAASALAVAAGAGVVFLTPLQQVVAARLATANVSTRENLYSAALDLAARSPLLGHGAPQPSVGLADSNDVSIGTHGQLWTILVSQGYAGLALFVAALVLVWLGVRPPHGRSPEVWLHALGPVVLLQMLFYDVIPMPLTVLLMTVPLIARARPGATPVHPKGTASLAHAA